MAQEDRIQVGPQIARGGRTLRTPSRVSVADLNFEEIFRKIEDRDRRLIKDALSRGRGALEASQAASAIRAKQMGAAIDREGIGERIKGGILGGAAEALGRQQAEDRAALLEALRGPERMAPLEEAVAEGQQRIVSAEAERRERASGARTVHDILGTGAQIAGSVLGAIPGLAPAGAAVSGAGTAQKAIASGATSEAIRRAAREASKARGRLSEQAREFKAPSLGPYEQTLGRSLGSGFGGYELDFLGGQQKKRLRRPEAELGEEALALSTYGGEWV